MLKTTIKNLLGHKIRVVITAIAIIAGVSFMAGTFVLTDTINASFNSLFTTANKNVDAVVRQQATFSVSSGGRGSNVSGDQRGLVPLSLVTSIGKVSGVNAVIPQIFVNNGAIAIGANNKPIDPATGAPAFGANWPSAPVMNPYHLASGSPPVGLTQVVIDKLTAKRGKLAVGDSIRIDVLRGPVRTVKVVGIVTINGSESLGGASVVMMDTPSAAQLFGQPGYADDILVHANSGVTQDQLVTNLQSVVPSKDQTITGAAYTKENEQQIQSFTHAFNLILEVFAGISLVAGAFLIYNIFGIVVAQRTKELALLRAIGASRQQVKWSVRTEAIITGLVASVLGLLVGIGLATLLTAIVGGGAVSSTSIVVEPRTVILALVVGVLVTYVSAYLPASRASRVSPMAALRDVAVDDSGRSTPRLVIGSVVGLLGLLLLVSGMAGKVAASIGLGGILLFAAVIVLGPRLAPVLVRGLGSWLPTVKGVTGRLARDNAMRSPKRTASTATSLILALLLIGIITVVLSSFTASFNAAVSQGFKGDFQLSAGNNGATLNTSLAARLEQLPQLSAVAGLSTGAGEILNKGEIVWGTDGPALGKTLDIQVKSGSLANLVGPNALAIDTSVSTLYAKPVGSTIQIGFPNGTFHTFNVVATYGLPGLIGAGVPAKFMLSRAAFSFYEPAELQTEQRILIKDAPGVTQATALAAVSKVTADYPTAEVQTLKQIQQAQTKQLNTGLRFVLVLLSFSVLIGFLGIAITLALSVIERTRELGLLRAIGMDKRRLKSMVRWETLLISLLGTLLGLGLGIIVGAALTTTFSKVIHTARTSIPIHTLIVYAVAAFLFGIVAAIYPARRAAKLNVLDAITTE